jgi:branched-chain amino acid transport system ATP-binding protein
MPSVQATLPVRAEVTMATDSSTSSAADSAATADQGLALHHITVRFGGLLALDDVSVRVPPGRIVGVIGPNGAGKTTLFNVICGFVSPQSGTIALDGRAFKPRPHHLSRHGIARTLQGVGQFNGMTVLENVLVGVRSGKAEEQAWAALERCGVAEHASALPGSLPYAKRKRVELARALASQPRILMLDEPAGGLDADEIRWLATLIQEAGCTVLLVEHHMDLVMSVCDEILVLDFGKTIALGTPSEIRSDDKVAEAYLGAAA